MESALERWAEELAQLTAQIQALTAKHERVQERIVHARALIDDLDESESPPAPAPQPVMVAPPPQVAPAEAAQGALFAEVGPKLRRKNSKGSWSDVIGRWIYANPEGMTHADLRAMIDSDPVMSARFNESDKGFYHAISRLTGRGDIVRHGPRFFSPQAHLDYVRAVGEGRAEEIVPAPGAPRHSPMGEAILDLITRFPGMMGGEIVNLLATDEEFSKTLTKRNTGAYNVLKRLVDRDQVRKEGAEYFPGPNCPPRDRSSAWFQQGFEALIPAYRARKLREVAVM